MRKKRGAPLQLGLYGGTFDPVHVGHLILAHDALEQAQLDAVLFIPCALSPHKPGRPPQATDAQRLAMLRAALRGEERFWLSRCDLDRPAPSYAIDTVLEIQDSFPRAQLSWLIGADQVAKLSTWRDYETLRREVRFLVLPRGDVTAPTRRGTLLHLPHPRRVDVSATEIRHRVRIGLPIDHLVPAPVAAYIRRRRLYLP